MFNVMYKGSEIYVRFWHTPVGSTCYISTGTPGSKYDEKTMLTWGESRIHHNDQKNRKVGRHASLTKATLKLKDKDLSRVIWNEYCILQDIKHKTTKPQTEEMKGTHYGLEDEVPKSKVLA